eukprot:2401862-Pleurochrysis_carterae.AAC.2
MLANEFRIGREHLIESSAISECFKIDNLFDAEGGVVLFDARSDHIYQTLKVFMHHYGMDHDELTRYAKIKKADFIIRDEEKGWPIAWVKEQVQRFLLEQDK